MDLKLSDIEANAVVHALRKHLEILDKSSTEKGIQIEIKTVEGLLDRISSLPGAAGI